jgi:acetyltransferase-like isoleucine patch superfamily enzyme
MKRIIKKIIKYLIKKSKRYVWMVADAYDIHVQRPGYPYGLNDVIIKDREDALRHRIPKSVYFNTASGTITIESNVVFGEDVKLLTGKHMNIKEASDAAVPLHFVPKSGRDIVIEQGCYIGSSAIVIGPAVIGNFSVIGAGAVVVGNIPPRTLVVGSKIQKIEDLFASSNRRRNENKI